MTAAQMREHEQYVMETIGIDASILMERAAMSAAKVIGRRIEKEDRILIVCGVGNNGADGVALARILTEKGFDADVLALGNPEKYTPLRRKQEEILRTVFGPEDGASSDGRISESLTDTKKRQREYAVIVDAILGIGTSRELSGELKEAVEWMNTLPAMKIALDIPTGICADTGKVLGEAFRADITITFGLRKQGLLLGEGKVYSGEMKYDSCGMVYPSMSGKDTFILNKNTVRTYIKRNPNGNKATFGKLSFFAGSKEIAGAAILNVSAALRSGAGYVRLCTQEENKEAVLEAAPETVLDLYGHYGKENKALLQEKVKKAVDFAGVICAGSGIGTGESAVLLMNALAEEIAGSEQKTIILDADALNLLAEDTALKEIVFQGKGSLVLTPHVLEFSRLSGLSVEEIKSERVKAEREFACKNKCILVLKDAQTVVAGPDGRVCISVKGNDGMAVAGSGDVLAGVIASMAGQIKDSYIAACSGVYIHGMAGDMAAEKLGTYSMLPTDMIHCLKKCMKKLGKEAD